MAKEIDKVALQCAALVVYETNYISWLQTDGEKYLKICCDYEKKFYKLGGTREHLKSIVNKINNDLANQLVQKN